MVSSELVPLILVVSATLHSNLFAAFIAKVAKHIFVFPHALLSNLQITVILEIPRLSAFQLVMMDRKRFVIALVIVISVDVSTPYHVISSAVGADSVDVFTLIDLIAWTVVLPKLVEGIRFPETLTLAVIRNPPVVHLVRAKAAGEVEGSDAIVAGVTQKRFINFFCKLVTLVGDKGRGGSAERAKDGGRLTSGHFLFIRAATSLPIASRALSLTSC